MEVGRRMYPRGRRLRFGYLVLTLLLFHLEKFLQSERLKPVRVKSKTWSNLVHKVGKEKVREWKKNIRLSASSVLNI